MAALDAAVLEEVALLDAALAVLVADELVAVVLLNFVIEAEVAVELDSLAALDVELDDAALDVAELEVALELALEAWLLEAVVLLDAALDAELEALLVAAELDAALAVLVAVVEALTAALLVLDEDCAVLDWAAELALEAVLVVLVAAELAALLGNWAVAV